MSTELIEEKEVTEDIETSEVAETPAEPLHEELSRLLSFKQKHVPSEGVTPCAACTTHVPVTTDNCPHCNSYIAPNNALVREALRRIDEINAELDGELDGVRSSDRGEPATGFWGKLKRFFSSDEAGDLTPEQPIEDGPRFLDRVAEGDQLIVVSRHGSWYKVKTRDSRTGWLYSTFVEED